MKLNRYLALLVAASLSCRAVHAVDIETVPVGNPGNAPDTRFDPTGFGSVGHPYRIGKYEVTAGQYTEFLNAVAKDDPNGLYNRTMVDIRPGCCDTFGYGANIQRRGLPGNFTYTVPPDWANRPVNYVSFWDAARFANWLHNGQPSGPQGPGTTEDGAYTLTPDRMLFNAVTRNPGARFFIPTENEWYKAAYHNKSASLAAGYFDFPTGSNDAPGNDITETTNAGNNANYPAGGFAIGDPYFKTEVGEFELSASPYGTFDQGGNVWEWNETPVTSGARGVRGRSFDDGLFLGMHASFRYPNAEPWREDNNLGFRVAMIPEPPALALAIALAAVGPPLRRRERRLDPRRSCAVES